MMTFYKIALTIFLSSGQVETTYVDFEFRTHSGCVVAQEYAFDQMMYSMSWFYNSVTNVDIGCLPLRASNPSVGSPPVIEVPEDQKTPEIPG